MRPGRFSGHVRRRRFLRRSWYPPPCTRAPWGAPFFRPLFFSLSVIGPISAAWYCVALVVGRWPHGRRGARLRESRLSLCEREVTLGEMFSSTVGPIVSLGAGFPPFRKASSRTYLCGFMPLSGVNLRGQGIHFLWPSRLLRPSLRERWQRNEVDLRELNSAAVSIPHSPEELAALIRGCRPPTAAPFLFTLFTAHCWT